MHQNALHPPQKKKTEGVLGLSLEQRCYAELPCGEWQKIMVSYILHSSFYIHLAPTEIRKMWCHITACCRQVKTHKKTVCCRVPHFIIRGKHTQGLFMILHYSFLRTTDIAQILKKHRGYSNTNGRLSYYRQITLFQSRGYCTLLCTTQRGQRQYC